MTTSQDGRVDRQGWIALGLSFLALFVSLGVRTSFGAYVTAWEQAFGASRSEVSLISSVSLIIYGFGLPVVGRMVDRFGARSMFLWSSVLMGAGLAASAFAGSVWQLVLCYGVIASVGFCGASSVTASISLVKWFPRNRSLAVGVSSCGIAAGSMLLAPLSIYLITTIGWRETLVIIGIACLLMLTGLMWFFYRDAPSLDDAHPGEAHPQPIAATGLPLHPVVLALALSVPYFVCGFTDLGLFSTHFVPLAEGRGISTAVIGWALAISAAVNLGSNLITGHLADRMSLTILLGAMYFWRAFSLLFLITADSPVSILCYAAMNGVVEAATIAPTAALCAQIYGPTRMGTAYGLLSATHQFGAAAGAFLIGVLYVHTHGYTAGLILSIVLLVVGSAMIQLARRRNELPARSIS